jgi:hypothetical protein
MKKIITVAIAATFSSALLFAATDAAAQASAAAASKPATPAAAKPAVHASGAHAKAPAKGHTTKRVVKKKGAVVAAREVIPTDAVKWNCAEGESLYVSGDMKRDQILTVYFDHRSYKLPRQSTTTGADRFYDAASTWDLVVIPTKAMLFEDGQHDRLADECKTVAMEQNNTPAPTQSNELLNKP